jgi:SAM-dependent methyltransferase
MMASGVARTLLCLGVGVLCVHGRSFFCGLLCILGAVVLFSAAETYFCELDDTSLEQVRVSVPMPVRTPSRPATPADRVPQCFAPVPQDLVQIERMCILPEALHAPFDQDDVKAYYTSSLPREYAILQACKGPGMHSTLCLPPPLGTCASTAAQPAMILKEICLGHAKSVLEIGCGQGFCTLFLAKTCPDVGFHAIDILPQHIAIAQRHQKTCALGNASFSLCDATTLDIPDTTGHFDLIFAVEALCHLDTPTQRRDFLTQASSRLTRNGRIVIIDGFRSPQYCSASEPQRKAMQIAEHGFRIREMPSKQTWIDLAADLDFILVHDRDLTAEALPFWRQGWKLAHFVLQFSSLLRWIDWQHPQLRETAANLCSVATVAHAMRHRGAAEYGLLILQKTP